MRFVALVALSALVPAAQAASPPEGAIRVTLLGTGGPELTPDRAGMATEIDVGGTPLLFDAGRNVLQRLYETRIGPEAVMNIFLTHLHSDHIEGLPGLWITPWFLLGRTTPLHVWGPPGTAAMIAGMRAMYAHDLAGRVNAFNQAAALDIQVTEIAPGVVYRGGTSRGGVVVTAFAVEHDDGDPAFGYRITYGERSVVLSGDTRPTPTLTTAARGADLLIQNVAALGPILAAMPEMAGVTRKLTTPEQAAALFAEARPRLAVYSHIVKKDLPGRSGDRTVIARTRAAGYRGPLVMGRDGMTILVGKTVKVVAPRSLRGLPELDSKFAGVTVTRK